MDEFHDSSPVTEDSERLRRRISDDGCLFIRGLLPREEVLAAREQALSALEKLRWLEIGAPIEQARPGPKTISEGDEEFFDAYALLQATEAFHSLAHGGAVRRLMALILGVEPLVHPRKVGRIAFPNNPRGTTPPHQDYRYIQGSTDVFTVWTPLGACPTELGGLRVLRGSHELGLLPTRWDNQKSAGLEVDVADADPAWATASYEPGDCVIFHSLTVHAATPNESGSIRLSADYRYQAPQDAVVADSLKPHYFPRVPDWPELVTNWRSLQPIAYPSDPAIASWNPPLDLLAPGRSRFFEFAGQASSSR